MTERSYGEITVRSDMKFELDDFMGRDVDIARVARVSTVGLGDSSVRALEDRDKGLIGYLMRDEHSSPFEHIVFRFRMELPLFVTRQLRTHRVNSYNEESGRYRELRPEFYVPAKGRPLVQTGKVGAYQFVPGVDRQYNIMLTAMINSYQVAWENYQDMLAVGVAREVARMVLPVSVYSSMFMTIKLRNALHFLSMRTEDERAKLPSHPQYEIAMMATKMEQIIAEKVPVTYQVWNEAGRPRL